MNIFLIHVFFHFYLHETLVLEYIIVKFFNKYLDYSGKYLENVVKFTMVNSKFYHKIEEQNCSH
ncbi:hypothetical protein CFSAN002369_07900 [Clostridium botulinum CFSAN002369]|nr:hypothetical protein CFSAN002369_07900 [Clostridium botulinum CFSAN002369]